jgi:hypothetical protein
LLTKLAAGFGQYMIGYFLGKSVKVQQLIGVDQVPTRAIEKVLKSRGWSPGKVALLVGGPDWPTSVTCGIVGVNIPQMLLGTLPVVALLVPCVLAGGCMGRVSPGENSDWTMLANAFTAAAAVVNMGAMGYAVYTVSETIQNDGDELTLPRPEHAAVAELTKREQAAVEAYRETSSWKNLTTFWRTLLLLSTTGMLLSNVVFVSLAEMCFRPFAVSSSITDSYEKDGLRDEYGNASVFNIIIAPTGWIAICMFFIALILHIIFVKSMSARSAQRLRPAEGPGEVSILQ